MLKGLLIELIWLDRDMIELMVQVSNERFSGESRFYENYGVLSQLASALRGFPQSAGDSRTFELGGLVRIHANCDDACGHLRFQVVLKSDPHDGTPKESVSLNFPVEPAGLDSFVEALALAKDKVGDRALLALAI